MRENCSKDSTIKLFGKILPLSIQSEFHPLKIAGEEEKKAESKDISAAEVTEITEKEEENYDDEDVQNHSTKEQEDSETSTDSNVKPKTPPVNEKPTKSKTDKEENAEESNTTEEKTLKKPDKILPCPRCKSMDTKFCYYNNYNVHQPRHFCKACQRYWTAGGTMRNVPVGAGRRKSKNSASHYRHLTIFEAQKNNGRVLSFGVDSPMCNSMAADKKKPLNGTGNGFHQNRTSPVSCKGKENVDNCSSGSVTVSNSNEEKGRVFASPNPWISGVPWPYQFPLQFYPTIWNYGGWNIPVMSPQSSTNQNVSILGKHLRNGETVKPYESSKHEPEKNKNGCVLVPKTLRIDDPDEAAKSSIWTTLGIKNESLNREKLLKAFQCKTEDKNRVPENSPILMANPAALSRSMNFRESS